MAKALYAGVSSKAQKIKEFYAGVSNVARKIKKGYVGVGDKAQQFYSSDFWLPDGVAASSCLAAYQFIGAASAAAAIKNIANSTDYDLAYVGAVTASSWKSATGFTISAWGGLDNTTLRGKKPVTVIARFSGATTTASRATVVSGGYSHRAVFLRTPFTTQSFAYRYTNALGGQYAQASANTTNGIRTTTNKATSGVIGVTFTSSAVTVYLNGTNLAVSKPTYGDYSMSGGPNTNNDTECAYRLIGMRAKNANATAWNKPEHWSWASFNCQAIAFYNTSLSKDQHKSVADKMLDL